LPGQFDFGGARGGHIGQRVAFEFVRHGDTAHVLDGLGRTERFDEAVRLAVQRAELEELGDQQHPREDRSDHQADHDDLNDQVGVEEHGRRRDVSGLAVHGLFHGRRSRLSGRSLGSGGGSSGGVSGRSGGGGGGRVGGRSGRILRERRSAHHQRRGAHDSDERVQSLFVEHLSPVPGWSS
jgi:hypothetical protein